MKKEERAELDMWEERYQRAKSAYQKEIDKMDRREKLYDGDRQIKKNGGENAKNTPAQAALHVRNITAELIESQVSSAIPMPKVTAIRPQDEQLAQKIENFLRNEIDRLPFEELNDQDERTTYIQGGNHYCVEWDITKRTHTTAGALEVNLQHPKTVIPQDGVLTGIEDMDYCFVEAARTKRWIEDTYGVNVQQAAETQPEIRSVGGAAESEDLLTQIYAYWRNDTGGIGLFSWVAGERIILTNQEDYQVRRQKVCAKCGAPWSGEDCSYCGSEDYSDDPNDANTEQEGHVLFEDIECSDGKVIHAWDAERDENGMPVMITELDAESNEMRQTQSMVPTVLPYYKPNVYPLVLRKNVSQFGKYLGGSDVDKIEDQQESIKKLETKAMRKVLIGGSILALPKGKKIRMTDEEGKLLEVDNPADMQKIGVYNLEIDNSADLNMTALFYDEARSTLGITDSFQGKRDSTATSGTAKQFAAQQSAGRLESKRVMKDAAYARLYEIMFKFALAYMDEPRDIVYTDGRGGRVHDVFNPYDFLEQDAAGQWFWNDQFLFSVDSSASLVNNREALWQETRMNYQQGCYGAVGTAESLYVFWRQMTQHHYPGAADMMEIFRTKMEQEQMAMRLPNSTPIEADSANMGADAAAAIARMDQQKTAEAMLMNGGGR